MPESRFDCLLITRPQPEASDLAQRLASLGPQLVIQPAFGFGAVKLPASEVADLQRAAVAGGQTAQPPLLVFTSTRAVEFGLPQLPSDILPACRLAAIGPATAAALRDAGLDSILQPAEGYTSEDLLRSLADSALRPKEVFIVAADGGRKALLEGLQQSGVQVRELFVYHRRPARLEPGIAEILQQSRSILSVWTSFNAIQQLASSLPAAAWQRVCSGECLVVSPRLARMAAGQTVGQAARWGAARVHTCSGPGNAELALCVRQLCHRP